MTPHPAPGWFGKLSMLGDFASRRLSPDWVRSCDVWVSAGLRNSQQELGGDWLSHYLAAPVWRFACAPGVWDARWWFGILMPSCDSVGRYYPLTLAHPRAEAPADRVALDHLDLWWSYLTQCGLATLADRATVDDLEDALLQCPPWPSAPAQAWRQTQALEDRTRYVQARGGTPYDLMAQVATTQALKELQGCSLWWPVRGDKTGAGGAPVTDALESCTRCVGLPPAQAFASLLLGSW